MSIAECEGVYMLTSQDVLGKKIYKIGRSDNLRQRLGSYSPNWCLLDCLPCKDSIKVEKMLIEKFKTKMKKYGGNEYFECDLDCMEVKKFFNDTLNLYGFKSTPEAKPEKKSEDKPEAKSEKKSEEKAEKKSEKKFEEKAEKKSEAKPEKKPEEKAEKKTEKKSEAKPEKKSEEKAEKKPEDKPENKPEKRSEEKSEKKPEDRNGKKQGKKCTMPQLNIIRDDILNTCEGRIRKKDLQESADMFNQLIDTIMFCVAQKPDDQEKRISDAMVGIVNKKTIKIIIKNVIKDEIPNVNNSIKISNAEVNKLY